MQQLKLEKIWYPRPDEKKAVIPLRTASNLALHLPPHAATHREESPLPLIPHHGSHTAAIPLCSWRKQSQATHIPGERQGHVAVERVGQEVPVGTFGEGTLPDIPKGHTHRGSGSLLERSGWQGPQKRSDILLIWLCHNHPWFFKEQGHTHSVLR